MRQNGSRVVQTRLQLAVASYILHTVHNSWQSAIDDLIQNLSIERLGTAIPANKIILTLIELLMVIPEEYSTQHMTLQERNAVRACLVKSMNQVFTVIKSILLQETPNIHPSPSTDTPSLTSTSMNITDIQQFAVKCFSVWSQNLDNLVLDEIHEHMIDLILSKLVNEELISYVVEAIIGIYTIPEIHKHPDAILKLIVKIVSCQNILDAAIADENIDICATLYNLYIQIAESHSRLLLEIVSNQPENRPVIWALITIILKCSATPGFYPVDETCSEQSFNFFYILQDDIVASDQPKAKEYLELFQPVFMTLIDTLLVKVQFPPDAVYNNEWTSDDKETFRCYRQDIGDTFMYSYNMLKSNEIIKLKNSFVNCLTQLIQITSSGQIIPPTEKSWQALEAVIFAISSVADNLTENEDVHLIPIFESLTNIPFGISERLLSTTIEMIGSYSDWIFHHPMILPRILTLLLLGLKGSSSMTAVAATMALKDLTRECQRHIEPYAPNILLACKEGLAADSPMKPREKARLMVIISQVLSLLPQSVIESYLNEILPPILNNLELSLKDLPQEQVFPARNEVVSILNILGMLFSSFDIELRKSIIQDDQNLQMNSQNLSQQTLSPLGGKVDTCHPLFGVFQQILPLLAQIGAKWISDESVISSLADVLRKAVVCLLNDVTPIVNSICSLAIQLYIPSCEPSLVDVMKQILLLFHSNESIGPFVINCFSQFISHTITVCQDMRDRTNLIEYFFDVCSSLMKKQPGIFTTTSGSSSSRTTPVGQTVATGTFVIDNEGLFRLACSALILPEKPTVKAAASFITQFINKSRNSEELARIVNANGLAVVNQVFAVMGGCMNSPRNVVEFCGDILLALNSKYSDNLSRWLSIQVAKDGFPSHRVTKEQKESFVQFVLREKKNSRKVKEYVTDFALISRGLVANEANTSPRRVDLLVLP